MKITKLKKIINKFSVYQLIFKQYAQEMRYFLLAKRRYLKEGYLKVNPSLLLRKRAHHLERYLLAPGSYPKKFAIRASRDIEKVLNHGKGIPLSQEEWARKILGEYKAAIQQNSAVFCPMLLQNVDRKQSSVITENLMKLIRQRRSRRIFLDIPLTADEKIAICEAAQYAPSSCNRQSLYLIFVESPDLKEFIASTIPGGYQFFSKAPCILLLLSDIGDYRYPEDRMAPFLDGAAAVQNIYLLCETMGLGCCWGSYTSFGTVLREHEVRKKFRIPDSHLIVASLAIGKSNQFVCEIPRDEPENRFWEDYYGHKNLERS